MKGWSLCLFTVFFSISGTWSAAQQVPGVVLVKLDESSTVRLDGEAEAGPPWFGTAMTGGEEDLFPRLRACRARAASLVFARAAARRGGVLSGQLPGVADLHRWYLVELQPAANIEAAVTTLQESPEVAVAEPRGVLKKLSPPN